MPHNPQPLCAASLPRSYKPLTREALRPKPALSPSESRARAVYDDGDENMKKTIGEAMVKSRNKQINPNNGLDDDDDLPPSPY